jgi:hypothetical protein
MDSSRRSSWCVSATLRIVLQRLRSQNEMASFDAVLDAPDTVALRA